MPDQPQQPPTSPTSPPVRRAGGGLDDYHLIADTIGGVPNLRWKDNVIQAIFIVSLTAASALIGGLLWGTMGLLAGLTVGLIGSFLVSGCVLMVLGWIRALKR